MCALPQRSLADSDSVKAVCDELLVLAVEYVELGGRIDEVFKRPLVFLEIDGDAANGTRDTVPTYKVADDLVELMATLRRLTAQRKQDQFGSGSV
jgi:hypothetical protein